MKEIEEVKQCPQALLLFIKNPIKGKVKTRLAAELGEDNALAIYNRLLEHTRSLAKSLKGVDKYLFYSDFIDEKDDWPASDFNKMLQPQVDDLGERMKVAFREVADIQSGKFVIIGSDCAQLSSRDIEAAFAALDEVDVVFGPAVDGGYYLCGMKDMVKDIFALKAWSTSTVLEESMALCREQGLQVKLLRKLSDIDFAEDWKKYGLDP